MEQLQKINLMQGAGMIVVMCLLVLAIVLFRRRMRLLLGLVLRFLCGVAGIYLVNLLMERAAFEAEIGINPVTVLVTTILGIPGLAMLYGIKIVSLLWNFTKLHFSKKSAGQPKRRILYCKLSTRSQRVI